MKKRVNKYLYVHVIQAYINGTWTDAEGENQFTDAERANRVLDRKRVNYEYIGWRVINRRVPNPLWKSEV